MRDDVHQTVTKKIIDFIECGGGLSVPLWDRGPMRLPLKWDDQPYRGINRPLLMVQALEAGYITNHWLTYKKAKDLGGQVRKGEKSSLSVYADTFIKTLTDKVTGDQEDVEMHFMRGYSIFNVSQIDGLPAKYYAVPERKLMELPTRLIAADAFVRHTGAKISEGGTAAFYRPFSDEIVMPPYEAFKDRESFYAVEFHELTHWTAHKSRLDRDMGENLNSPQRAREEILAELGAAFLCASLEITPDTRPDHAGYVESWLRVLRADNRAIFAAASGAQKATDFLHALQPRPPTDPA